MIANSWLIQCHDWCRVASFCRLQDVPTFIIQTGYNSADTLIALAGKLGVMMVGAADISDQLPTANVARYFQRPK